MAPCGDRDGDHGARGGQAEDDARGNGGDLQRGLRRVHGRAGERGGGDDGQEHEHGRAAAAGRAVVFGESAAHLTCPSGRGGS